MIYPKNRFKRAVVLARKVLPELPLQLKHDGKTYTLRIASGDDRSYAEYSNSHSVLLRTECEGRDVLTVSRDLLDTLAKWRKTNKE